MIELDATLIRRFPWSFEPKNVIIVDDKQFDDWRTGKKIWCKDRLAQACEEVGHRVLLCAYSLEEARGFLEQFVPQAEATAEPLLDVALLDQQIYNRKDGRDSYNDDGGRIIAQTLLNVDLRIGIFSTSYSIWPYNLLTPSTLWEGRPDHPHDTDKKHAPEHLRTRSTWKFKDNGWGQYRVADIQAMNWAIRHDEHILARLAGMYRFSGIHHHNLAKIESDWEHWNTPQGQRILIGKQRREDLFEDQK